MIRILVVSHGSADPEPIAAPFRSRGDRIVTACDCRGVDAALREHLFDVAILRLASCGADALAAVGHARHRVDRVPLLVVAGEHSVVERVSWFNLGVDGCLGAPFAEAELVATADALARRGVAGCGATLTFGRVSVDTTARRARVDRAGLDLRPREFSLLEALLLEPGKVVPKQWLYERMFDAGSGADVNALELYVHRLRRKLEPVGVRIRTVRNVGYAIEGT